MPVRAMSAELEAAITEQKPSLQILMKLALRDDSVLGFTKHPVPIVYDGVTYRPGLNISVVQSQVGLSVDNLEATGGYKDGIITEADVAAGIYDDCWASLLLFDRENHVAADTIIQRCKVREIRSQDDVFNVELASLMHLLQAQVGRIVTPYCDTDVFSAKCKLLEAGTHPNGKPLRWASATVSVVNSSIIFRANDATAFPTDHFTNGKLTWLTGANAGVLSEVKAHGLSGGNVAVFTLHEPPRKAAITVGDTFKVLFGCNKTEHRCKAASNFTNFQGYPYLPGGRRSMYAK